MAIIRLRLLKGVCVGSANGGDKPAGEIVELDANDGMAMIFMNQAEQLPLDVPVITSITPSSVAMGQPDLMVTVKGGKFYENDSRIMWNGSPERTNFLNAGELSTIVRMSTVSVPSTVEVKVRTLGHPDVESLPVFFEISN